MLNISHGVIGATIAAQPLNPLISLPLAFVSHFFLDAIPHWDWGIKFKSRSTLVSFLFSLIDGLVSMLIVYLFLQKDRPFAPIIWLGMFAGMGQDFLDAPANFLKLPPFSPTTSLHRLFHDEDENFIWGIIPQVLIILTCLAAAT